MKLPSVRERGPVRVTFSHRKDGLCFYETALVTWSLGLFTWPWKGAS